MSTQSEPAKGAFLRARGILRPARTDETPAQTIRRMRDNAVMDPCQDAWESDRMAEQPMPEPTEERVPITLSREQAFGDAELLSDIARQERQRRRGAIDTVSLSDGGLLQIEGLVHHLRALEPAKLGRVPIWLTREQAEILEDVFNLAQCALLGNLRHEIARANLYEFWDAIAEQVREVTGEVSNV